MCRRIPLRLGLKYARRFLLHFVIIFGVFALFMICTNAVLNHGYSLFGGSREGENANHVGERSLKLQLCNPPKLEMYPNQKFRYFFMDIEKPKCLGEDWVEIDRGIFRIVKSATEKYGNNITCDFRPILRGNDFEYYYGASITNVRDGWNVTAEVAKVSCHAGENNYENYHISIPYVENIHRRVAKFKRNSSLGLNVLMFGFDSVSRMTWLRKLPKSYAYMKDVLQSVVMEGYNALGDGTPPALFSMLTGHVEGELPNSVRGTKGAVPVDGFPWVWKDFEKAGYVHQYVEDSSRYGCFTYRLLGFKNKPTDHYIRRFYTEMEINKPGQYCLGAKYKHSILLNYMTEFEKMYESKSRFSFGFHGELSHNTIRPLNVADDELKEWLEMLHNGGFLNNTLLILMADHGSRYSTMRATLQGAIEERNPFFSIRVPAWFKEKYPVAYKNIQVNSRRLVTGFDVHATLHDIIDFKNRPLGTLSERGISLFTEIPASRSCQHARLTRHWCNCLHWSKVMNDAPKVHQAANTFITFVNNLTQPERNNCHVLSLDKILYARVQKPEHLQSGWKNMKLSFTGGIAVYQLVIHTKPGAGHFEATVAHNGGNKFNITIRDISRTNAYGSDPDCISSKLPHLNRFCYCRK